MTVIRLGISAFIVVLVAVSAAGWVWTGANQPRSQALASRLVLGIAILAGLAGLRRLWRGRDT